MGARCTFVFKTSEDHAVALYSHWGEDSMYPDLAAALEHARPRWNDESYATRMVISHLLQHNILDETGFGIYGYLGIVINVIARSSIGWYCYGNNF